jgi:outer membrane protein
VHRKIFNGLALAALITLTARAQSTNHSVRSLSLKECVDMALAHNLSVQIERFSPQIADYHLRAAYGAYDPALELTLKRTFVDQPQAADFKKYSGQSRNDNEYELTIDSVGPGLLGRLPTGLSYNLFARSDYLDGRTFDLQIPGQTSLPPVFTNNYYTTAGITLRQPLLKDFWIDRYRETIQLNKKNLKISEIALKGQLMIAGIHSSEGRSRHAHKARSTAGRFRS